MKEMKLISMTAFVLTTCRDKQTNSYLQDLEYAFEDLVIIENYAKFLSQPLNIGMFVPTIQKEDGSWEVLEEPKQYVGALEFGYGEDYEKALQFQQAKSKVLFEGFEVEKTEYNGCFSLFVKSTDLGFDKLYFDTFHNKEGGFVRRRGLSVEGMVGTINPKIGKITLTEYAQRQIGLLN